MREVGNRPYGRFPPLGRSEAAGTGACYCTALARSEKMGYCIQSPPSGGGSPRARLSLHVAWLLRQILTPENIANGSLHRVTV